MKRLIFLLLPLLLFGQKIESYPPYSPMFKSVAGRDTILSAANLHSIYIDIGKSEGVLKLGIQSDTVSGSVAKDIAVYAKFRLAGLEWGVPSDSIAVDSIYLGTIDSAYVNDETPWYYELDSQIWWTIFDEMEIILDPAANADSIIFSRSKVRGY